MKLLDVKLDDRSRAELAAEAERLVARTNRTPASVASHAAQGQARLPEVVRDASSKLHAEAVEGVILRSAIDPSGLPATPIALPTRRKVEVTPIEVTFLLLGAAFGEAFGWTSIQHGSLVNDVFPIEQHAESARSSGYKIDFRLHTEDAFHPENGRYLALLCVRNEERVPTLLASVGDVPLPAQDEERLRQPHFRLGANVGHDTAPTGTRLQPILFGRKAYPYFRINLNVEQQAADLSSAARLAAGSFRAALMEASQTILLAAGDVLILDNYRLAHGRMPYVPNALGTGRWLKRLYLARSLEALRKLSCDPDSRVVVTCGD